MTTATMDALLTTELKSPLPPVMNNVLEAMEACPEIKRVRQVLHTSRGRSTSIHEIECIRLCWITPRFDEVVVVVVASYC